MADRWLDKAQEFAKMIFVSEGELVPIAILQDSVGMPFMCPLFFKGNSLSKESIEYVRALAITYGCSRITVVIYAKTALVELEENEHFDLKESIKNKDSFPSCLNFFDLQDGKSQIKILKPFRTETGNLDFEDKSQIDADSFENGFPFQVLFPEKSVRENPSAKKLARMLLEEKGVDILAGQIEMTPSPEEVN